MPLPQYSKEYDKRTVLMKNSILKYLKIVHMTKKIEDASLSQPSATGLPRSALVRNFSCTFIWYFRTITKPLKLSLCGCNHFLKICCFPSSHCCFDGGRQLDRQLALDFTLHSCKQSFT